MDTMRTMLWALALGALSSGCTELPVLVADNTCGNGILEPNNHEDCEPGRAIADGLRCGEAGDELECRFVCGEGDGDDDFTDFSCPLGWGCSADGFCQPPAGRFGDPQPIQGITTPLAIGDFDADGYQDLATVQEPLLRVAFGNASTRYAVTLRAAIDSAPSAPAVSDINNDGLDDLIVASGDLINIYLGESGQDMSPLLLRSREYGDLPSRLAMVAVTMNEPRGRQQPVLISADQERGEVLVRLADVDDAEPVAVGGDANTLAEVFATGDLLPDDSVPPRHELAIAPNRSRAVVLLTLDCTIDPDMPQAGPGFDPDCALVESGRVDAPVGWEVSSEGTWAADVDGDGVTDLLFGLQGPGGRQALAAALGDGAGFEPAFVLPVEYSGAGPRGDMPVAPGAQAMMRPTPAWVLAVADLDGNGRADVVTALGVEMAADGAPGDPLAFETGYIPKQRMSNARVTDLNRDGRPDLVVTAGPGLLTLLNVDGEQFNEAETFIGEQATSLLVGDLDGDLLPDILVHQGSQLFIGFNNGRGVIDGLDETVSEAGDLTPVIVRWAADSDAVDDVMIVVSPPDDVAYLLQLQGSGTRRLAAPLRLPDIVDSLARVRGRQEQAGIVGDRNEGEGWQFIAVRGEDLGNAQVEPPLPLVLEGDCGFADNADLLFAAFQPDADAAWETLVAVEALTQTVPDAYLGPWAPRLLHYRGGDSLRCSPLAQSPLAYAPTGMVVEDLDGDGAPDLVLSQPLFALGPADQPSTVDGGIAVWWGDGDGGFEDEPLGLVLEGTGSRPDGPASTFFRGPFAAIELDGSPGAELILLFGNGLHRLDLADREVIGPTPLTDQRVDPMDIQRIDAVDLDVDGVPDLLLSGGSHAVLLLQEPCTPQEAAEGDCERRVVGPEEQ